MGNTVQRRTDVTEMFCQGASAESYRSCRSRNKVSPGRRGLPADNRVPEGRLADGGRGAFLSRSRRQEAQAGELVSQSHPEKTHSERRDAFTPPGCAVAAAEKCDGANFHLYLLCMMA